MTTTERTNATRITREFLQSGIDKRMMQTEMARIAKCRREWVRFRLIDEGLHSEYEKAIDERKLDFATDKKCINCGEILTRVGTWQKGVFWFCPTKSITCQIANIDIQWPNYDSISISDMG